MSGPLAGRSAVVTGASRGIGAATARALAGAGARVVLIARSAEALADLARDLGNQAVAVAGDLSDPENIPRLAAAVESTLRGSPDILVNNAGVFRPAPIERTAPDVLKETLRVNLVAPFLLVRAFLPAMRERGTGHIVTIGSVADRQAFTENAAYSASKYGVRGLHEVLRAELRGSGVRATLVSPGPVDTPIWDDVPADAGGGRFPRARTEMLPASAVADAVLFAVTRPAEVNVDELRLTRA